MTWLRLISISIRIFSEILSPIKMSNIESTSDGATDLSNNVIDETPAELITTIAKADEGILSEDDHLKEFATEQQEVLISSENPVISKQNSSEKVEEIIAANPEISKELKNELNENLNGSLDSLNGSLTSLAKELPVPESIQVFNVLESTAVNSVNMETLPEIENPLVSDNLDIAVGVTSAVESLNLSSEGVFGAEEDNTRAITLNNALELAANLGDSTTPELAPAIKEIPSEDRSITIQKLLSSSARKESVLAKNVLLQGKLAVYLKTKRITGEFMEVEKSAADQQIKYFDILDVIKGLHTESISTKQTLVKTHAEFVLKVKEKDVEFNEMVESFYKYKRAVALNTKSSRTGKTLDESVLEQLEATERKKESEVVAARLDYIKLRNKFKRQEAILKQKVLMY
jgi:hypothetical protein